MRISPRFAALVPLMLLAGLTLAQGPRAEAAEAESGTAMLRTLAEDGNVGAQVQVAIHYLDGSGGFPQDPRLAVKWFERAAQLGNAYAQFRLGELYLAGKGATRNALVAADWLEKAAHRGNAAAQLTLGQLFLDGTDVPAAPMRGEYWLERAAIEGNAEARDRLARVRDARIVDRSSPQVRGGSADGFPAPTYQEALRVVHLLEYAEFRIEETWYQRLPELQRLAEDGDPNAQFVVGTHCLQGSYGQRRDVAQALAWYRRAAEGGSRRAALALARLYESGLAGVAVDPAEAHRWASRAASLAR